MDDENVMPETLETIAKRITALGGSIDESFAKVDQQFTKVDDHFGKVDSISCTTQS